MGIKVKFKSGLLTKIESNEAPAKAAGTLYFANNTTGSVGTNVQTIGRLYYDIDNNTRLLIGAGDAMYTTSLLDAGANKLYLVGAPEGSKGNGSGQTYSTNKVYVEDGAVTATKVYNAVWNDYAEYRELKDNFNEIPYGKVAFENGDDTLSISTERLQPCAYIISDTFGTAMGDQNEKSVPIGVAGRVLAYTNENRNAYKPGDAVCSGPNGTVSKMTQEEKINHPECVIGYVSAIPSYEEWGTGKVKVDNRIWIRIK